MKLSIALNLLLAAESVCAFSVHHTRAFVKQGTVGPLYGLLDEIQGDGYDLSGASSETKVKMDDAYEIFLGDLVFSTNDPRVDIMNNFERATDEDFLSWLKKKFETSKDPEERTALKDLREMILDLKKRAELSQIAEERKAKEAEEAEKRRIEEAEAAAEAGREMSAADVLRKATAIQTGGDSEVQAEKEKKTFYEQEITPEIRMSYEDLLKKVLPPYQPGETVASVVYNNYDQFDAQFVKVLNERADGGDQDSRELLTALSFEQQKRISAATETLKGVLSLGDPMRMEGAIVKLAREGKIDEPFLLLLEANANQARSAGASGPAELMLKLKKRAEEEKDKLTSSKEIRLIRKLLRASDSAEREKILEEAFTPKEALLVPGTAENAAKAMDGEMPEQEKPMPDVPPPDFINACKAVLLNFGNISTEDDEGDLASRIKQIAAEAEVVATRIYGQGMSIREQQDRAWKEQSTSIFDLERMELEAEAAGEAAPWTNPDNEDIFLPGFDKDGKMQVGGQ